VRLRLTRKLAEEIDGINLANHEVGDQMDLPERKAELLIAEGWAIRERRVEGPVRVIAFRRAHDLGRAKDEDDASRAS
jgi:hypothetical protein